MKNKIWSRSIKRVFKKNLLILCSSIEFLYSSLQSFTQTHNFKIQPCPSIFHSKSSIIVFKYTCSKKKSIYNKYQQTSNTKNILLRTTFTLEGSKCLNAPTSSITGAQHHLLIRWVTDLMTLTENTMKLEWISHYTRIGVMCPNGWNPSKTGHLYSH